MLFSLFRLRRGQDRPRFSALTESGKIEPVLTLVAHPVGRAALRLLSHFPSLSFFSLLATSEQLVAQGAGISGLCGSRRHPAEQSVSQVDSEDRATRVAGEEAALSLELAAGDGVLVG